MSNLPDEFFLQNPLHIAERTQLTMSLATALWNTQHEERMNEAALYLFLCDETRGDLTDEQKCFVRKCNVEVDQLYLRMLCKQEQENRAMCRPALPAKSRCAHSFCRGKAYTHLLTVRPLRAPLAGFRGTKEKAG